MIGLRMPKIGLKPIHLPKLGLHGMAHGFRHLQQGGHIKSDIPGRTDKHPVTVPSGSYVLTADTVSALGENNTDAGVKKLDEMFAPGTRFGPRLRIPAFAGGGSVEPVPIVVAGGEYIIPPQIVRRIGGGDMQRGHDILDRFQMQTRKKHIKKLQALKPPKGSK